ncbi:hypothetical protein BJ912DRAFT_1051872 [Pholiota molesta]|nr:hypothetical protein BJ912DRAFT_1051872 [Pholiota molesta]
MLSNDMLSSLHEQLDICIAELDASELTNTLLPAAKKIAPNQNSWTETAAVMNVPVKSKKRRAHADPYAGGEQSGKRARNDARQPPKKSLPFESPQLLLMQSTAKSIPLGPPPIVSNADIPRAISMFSQQHSHIVPSNATLPTSTFASSSFIPAVFDPKLVDIRDTRHLYSLRRLELNALCRLHGVSAGGTNEDIITRLQNEQ